MEEEMNNRKVPGFVLSTFLFLFFYLLIRTVYQDLPRMYYDMMDATVAEDEPIIFSLILACLDIFMLCLSFWSIIRLLKGKLDGITCVRWALGLNLIVVLFQLLQLLGRIIYIHWMYALSPVLQLFLTIIFLFYLGKSKSVKQLYPKSERKFSPGGWVWLLFFILSVFSISYMLYTKIEMEIKSKKQELSSLSIPSNSYSDGLLLFESTNQWSHSTKEIMDMEDMPQEVTLWELASDSICELVMSGVSPKRRHSDYMSILLQSLPEEQKYFSGEIIACDTIINDDQYYIDQYQYVADSISYLWTFSVRFDAETHKFCALSKYGKQHDERMDKDEVLSFLKSVVFDLTPFIIEQ
ncbi:hypothetical protein L6467_13035 [Segatella bryantii]|uniref:hypothetical protein n=1 Tax=Segatella bryantii TaxID=77095 RepID=UPI001EDBF329|nr:hypothetical protein [Segatella bryantii]UKK73456.1 hypothetical protein L6467_13035 [Segatella bryantii]